MKKFVPHSKPEFSEFSKFANVRHNLGKSCKSYKSGKIQINIE